MAGTTDTCIPLLDLAQPTADEIAATAAEGNTTMDITGSGSEASPISGNDDELRRSDRKRTSTIIKVDGQFILKQNNYVVTGSTYVHGTYEEDAEKISNVKKQKTATGIKKSPTVRKQPSYEVARIEHNENVKKSIQEKESIRRDFLVENRATLEPFMEEATNRMVLEWGGNKKTAFVRNELFVQPELVTGGEMRDYQLAGLNFMVEMHQRNIGMILGDEMGLGKTLQTISLFCHLKENIEKCGPSLVVCPLTVLYSWCSELAKWAPSLRVLRLHSSNADDQAQQRRELVENAAAYDVVVTTYEMVKVPQLQSMWSRQYFRYLVLDEGHKIKSGETLLAQAVRKVHCENRLLLTGTPLQNNLSELVQLLNFLLPDIFTSLKPFENAFDITNNFIDKEKMLQSQKVLSLFMIRRLKEQVEKLLPKKIETKVYCPLSRTQIFWYKQLLLKDLHFLEKHDSDEGGSIGATGRNRLAGLFMQLRKCCLHPYLFDGAEENIGQTTIQELIGASGKLAVLDSLLRSLFQKGHRCVLFSQFTSVLDIISDYCTMRGWRHVCFDGRTPRAKRNFYVSSFNAKDSPIFLFLMSTRSGSMGLNLQTADTVVLFDSDFNPQMDLQAQARVHRIGQTKTVHVYRLVAGGTVEERLVERAEKKLMLDQMVNTERGPGGKQDRKNSTEETLSAGALLSDIKFGSAAVFGDSSLNTLPSKKDIESITDRRRTETDSNGKLKGNAHHDAATFDLGKKLSESQTFQGIDFKQLRNEKKGKGEDKIPSELRGISRMWIDQESKRKKKNRIVMVNGMSSGYGQAFVPVLASNNYELAKGESSVFDRELGGRSKDSFAVKKKKMPTVPEHQDFCQLCGDGGLLYLCSRCPCAVHVHCFPAIDGISASCPHHHCVKCNKASTFCGGLMYPCQACPSAYCEDCLPKDDPGFRYLEKCDRFEEIGFNSTKMSVYIHCNSYCENYAIEHLGWKPESMRPECPEEIDVSADFGSEGKTESTLSAILPPRAALSDAQSLQATVSTEFIPKQDPANESPAAVSASASETSFASEPNIVRSGITLLGAIDLSADSD